MNKYKYQLNKQINETNLKKAIQVNKQIHK